MEAHELRALRDHTFVPAPGEEVDARRQVSISEVLCLLCRQPVHLVRLVFLDHVARSMSTVVAFRLEETELLAVGRRIFKVYIIAERVRTITWGAVLLALCDQRRRCSRVDCVNLHLESDDFRGVRNLNEQAIEVHRANSLYRLISRHSLRHRRLVIVDFSKHHRAGAHRVE